jgi:hypothetical protein
MDLADYLLRCLVLTIIKLRHCFNSSLELHVNKFGLSSRVRSDKGLENVLIADHMIEKTGADRCSMITHNHLFFAALHHVFLPRINKKLELWMTAWANHRTRTTRTSPLRLWLPSQMQNPVGLSETATEDEVANYGIL